MSFNLRQLEDRAADVDPDLRYMALEDLQKYLTNPKLQVRNVTSFVPLNFRLLADPVSEVQNQAVRTFPLLIRHVSDPDVLSIVEQLYEKSEQAVNDSTFSTSVPHLALRNIFNESSSRFQNSLAKSVFALLIPRIMDGGSFSIDRVEILIDLLRNLGHVLSMHELSSLVYALIDRVLVSSGIVSKRSMVAIDQCLEHVDAVEASQKTRLYDGLLLKILGHVYALRSTFFTLTQVVLARAQNCVSPQSIDSIFSAIVEALDLDSLVVSLDELDVDKLIQLNRTRETGLLTLSLLTVCVPTGEVGKLQAIMTTVANFLAYDPFADQENDDSDDNVSDYDSDFDFEDEEIEQYEATGENDALAAKLRLAALVNIKSLITNHSGVIGSTLSANVLQQLCVLIGDKVDFVSDEAVTCCVLILRETNSPSEAFFHSLQQQLFSVLLTQKNIVRFKTAKTLIEALIVGHRSFSSESLGLLGELFLKFDISMQNFSELARLYKSILEEYNVSEMSHTLTQIIVNDIHQSLGNPNIYHNLLSEVLSVLQILCKQSTTSQALVQSFNSQFFPEIIKKASNRQYPSDLRQALLRSSTEIIVHVPLTAENSASAVDVFLQYLEYEISMNSTLEFLNRVLLARPEFLSPQLQEVIFVKTLIYMKSSDSSLYMPSLRLLDLISSPTGNNAAPSADLVGEFKQVLLEMVTKTSETILMNSCFNILCHNTKFIPADEHFFRFLVDCVINVKLVDVDNINVGPIENLIESICENNTIGGERIYEIAMHSLVLGNFISAKIMAILVFKLGLISEVDKAEDELLSTELTSSGVDKIVFDIHFLGCISSRHELKSIKFDEFFAFLNSENEQIALAAARSIGLLILRDFDYYLPTLLNYYHDEGMDEHKKILILVAIKQVLKENPSQYQIDSLRDIWHNILDVLIKKEGQLNNKKVSELKLAGDILSKIIELDTSVDYQQEVQQLLDSQGNQKNQFLIYTVVVIINELLNKDFFVFDIENVEIMVQFLAIPNIELKSAIISTLLTGVYTKIKGFARIIDHVILPCIYDELAAKEEFKKVIPMGPYKYVVDEGLEVRKLGYEFINAVVNINEDPIQSDFNVEINEVRLFGVLCAKGLRDAENDIINCTIDILMQVVQADENVLIRVNNFGDAVASLGKIINRKLRAKASTQETESHEDTLRNVIRLSKVMNDVLKKNNNAPADWATFYYELQNKHQLLFNSV